MKGMLVNVGDFFVAWKHSKIDGTIWLVTFCSVILIDIDIGLCVGVISSLLYITVQGQKIKIETLGNIPKTDIYVPIHKYQSVSTYELCQHYTSEFDRHLRFFFSLRTG